MLRHSLATAGNIRSNSIETIFFSEKMYFNTQSIVPKVKISCKHFTPAFNSNEHCLNRLLALVFSNLLTRLEKRKMPPAQRKNVASVP